MSAIIGNLPVTLANGNDADASQVMTDLNYIVNQVNANGLPSADLAAQMLSNLSLGSVVAVRLITANGNYVPSSTKAQGGLVIGVGGGGAGGGISNQGGGSQTTFSPGGNAGSWGLAYIASGFTTTPCTIGAGSTGTPGGGGGQGGETTFGSLLLAPGGFGGPAVNSGLFLPPTSTAGFPSGSALLFGAIGNYGTASYTMGGAGGNSILGTGGCQSVTSTGNQGTGFGAGGSGIYVVGPATNYVGAPGSSGAIVVIELAGS